MMRQCVVVDGITLTDEQVKRAVELLNQPFRAGDIVTNGHAPQRYLIVARNSALDELLAQKFGSRGNARWRVTDGSNTWAFAEADLKKVDAL